MRAPPCTGCGLPIAGGTERCQGLFEALTARTFTDIRFGGVHRMVVDVYALQHPDRYCVSGKSLAAHLCGLCDLIEHGGNRALPNEALGRWLDGPRALRKPELPAFRGAITIADMIVHTDPTAYRAAVEDWARATWRPMLGCTTRRGRGSRRRWARPAGPRSVE